MVALYVVALDDPQRLLTRVKQRVREGGHDVPADRILARYPRTLANLSKAVHLATVAYLYESREIEARFNAPILRESDPAQPHSLGPQE